MTNQENTKDLPCVNTHKLTENEVLKFKNLGLQRQVLNKEHENIAMQEELIAKMVSDRLGENIKNWKFDIQQGIVTRIDPLKDPK